MRSMDLLDVAGDSFIECSDFLRMSLVLPPLFPTDEQGKVETGFNALRLYIKADTSELLVIISIAW
ncbi:hypothetical protein Pint_12991 [Pistacia integerrima]|uniref:Uncharacterized protein n=1 Tax=Pistacia integerrima TaxID=434235 RepID=A0ACC0Y700_9ROSI|nr:hypothetical protein Pint_12991 [Pistacia integerrima]